MISLSPLITVHPCFFHQTRVRSSTQCYLSFNLTMIRSPGFGSTTTNCNYLTIVSPLSDSVSLRLQHFHALTSLHTVTRRLILQKARRQKVALPPTCCGRMVSGSISLPSPGFFSPFPHGTGSLSVATSYLALDRGRPSFRQGFSGLAVLRTQIHEDSTMSNTGLSPSLAGLPMPFSYSPAFSLREVLHVPPICVYNPLSATACTLTLT